MGLNKKNSFVFIACFLFFLFNALPAEAALQLAGDEEPKGKLDGAFVLSNQRCDNDANCTAADNGSCRLVNRTRYFPTEGSVTSDENFCGYPKIVEELPIKVEPVAPVLQINIPTILPFTTENMRATAEGFAVVPFIGQYFAGIYKWAVMIGGLVAAIMIIFGGFTYLISRGNAQQIEEAKSRITGAIFGLALLFGSYAMLYLINPDLVQFKGLKIQVIKRIELSAGLEPTEIELTKGMECFLNTFGKTEDEVKQQLETVQLTTATTPSPLNVQVHKQMAQALLAVARKIEDLNYKLTDTGGFEWRPNVNNPNELSLHSFGIAVDLNTAANPNYFKKDAEGQCKTDMPPELINAFKSNGFSWGGEFKTVCDAMHFEWRGPCAGSGGGAGSAPPAALQSGSKGCCCASGNPQPNLTEVDCGKLGGTLWRQGACQPSFCQ